jgi:hypothetical protein
MKAQANSHKEQPTMKPLLTILTTVLAVALALTACDNAPDGPGPGPLHEPGPGADHQPGPQSDPGPQSSAELIPGSGTLTTETHQVTGFDRIELAGEGRVIVTIGDDPGLTISTDDNIHEYLEATVSNGTLLLATRGNGAFDIDPTDSVTWTVQAPEIAGLQLSGAGFIGVTGLQSDRVEAAISGAGDIELADITASHFAASLSGVGIITASGTTDSVELTLTGVGDIDTEALRASTGAVSISSAGNIIVAATDSLDVDATGLGTVTVHGSPDVTGDTGRVTHAAS